MKKGIEMIEGNKIFILFVVIIMFLRLYVFNLVVVNGDSMLPTLHGGDFLMVSRIEEPQHGDIVVFKEDKSKKNLVKRVIGLEGDFIEFKEGVLYLNGEEINEDYINGIDFEDFRLKEGVPDGKAFVLGDNRSNSRDSRKFGFIDKEDLDVVKVRYFPFDRLKYYE